MIKTVKIALFLKFAILIFLINGCTQESKTTKKAEKPIFSKMTGVYLDSVDLSISSNTDGAEIYYTLDDTEPNKTTGIKYEKLFNIIRSTTVKAIAIKEGHENSEVVSAFYKINKTPAIPLIPTEQVSTSTMAIKITIPEGETYIYTIDGTEPTLENGIKVSSELTFSKTTKLKVRSFSKDGIGSKTIDAVFRVLNLKEIKIDTKPVKEKYFKGDKFDITGLKVKAIYSDEEISQEQDITTRCALSGFESAIVGDQTIKVNFEGKMAEFKINVNIRYTITYDGNQNTSGTAPIDKNSPYTPETRVTILSPGNLEKTGFRFWRWATKDSLIIKPDEITDKPIDFYSPEDTLYMVKNLTLYAIWEVVLYNITYNSNGGTSVLTDTAIYNQKIFEPNKPVKENLRLEGWYKEPELINKWDFQKDKVTSDIILYAKWVGMECSITFHSNGGTTVAAILNIPYNTVLEAPTRPTKEGIKFAGWFKDPGLNYDWNFNIPITEDIILYAKWVNFGFDYEKFKSEKAAWELSKIKNYSFDYYGLGFMSFTYRIKVENGIYKEATKDIPDDYKISIDDIYGDLEKRYLKAKEKPYFEEIYLTSIDIEYDKINHIPIHIYYNYYVPYGTTIDGTFNYGIENFKEE